MINHPFFSVDVLPKCPLYFIGNHHLFVGPSLSLSTLFESAGVGGPLGHIYHDPPRNIWIIGLNEQDEIEGSMNM